MNVNCKHREEILQRQEPQELAALTRHAEQCADCREELAVWRELEAAAPALQKSWESPELWPHIRQALAEQSQTLQRETSGWSPVRLWEMWTLNWKPLVAAAALIALTAVSVWMLSGRFTPEPQVTTKPQGPVRDAQRVLMTEQAVKQIEAKEAEYVRSIEELSKLAGPQVQQPSSALMASYREKLVVLDAAIGELRSTIERNKFNAHLRRELVTLYQEKQKTLEALAQGDANVR